MISEHSPEEEEVVEQAVQRVQQKSWRLDNNRNNNSNVITRSHIRPSGLALLGNRQQQHKNLQFSCEIPQFPRYYIMRMHQYLIPMHLSCLSFSQSKSESRRLSIDGWRGWLGWLHRRQSPDRQTDTHD